MRIVRTSMATADVVREAQRVLRDLGYYAGPLDGILGPEERRAIWNFQKHGASRARAASTRAR